MKHVRITLMGSFLCSVACAHAGTFSFVKSELIPSTNDTHSQYSNSSSRALRLFDTGRPSVTWGTDADVSISSATLRWTIKWVPAYPGEIPPTNVAGTFSLQWQRLVSATTSIANAPAGSYPTDAWIDTVIDEPAFVQTTYTYPGGTDMRSNQKYVADGRRQYTIDRPDVVMTFAMEKVNNNEWKGVANIYDAFTVEYSLEAAQYCTATVNWVLGNYYQLKSVNGIPM